MTVPARPTITALLRDARTGCRVLAGHTDRIAAYCAASARGAQDQIRTALLALRGIRAGDGSDGAALDVIERALVTGGVHLQDHDVIRQYQAIVSAALGELADRLDELGASLPEQESCRPAALADGLLDTLWRRYVSDEQREVHRRLAGSGGAQPRLPRTELF